MQDAAHKFQVRLIWGFMVFALALVWAGVGWALRSKQEQALASAQAETRALARAYRENVDSLIKRADLFLQELSEQLALQPTGLDMQAVSRIHRRFDRELSDIGVQTAIADRQGQVLVSNLQIVERPLSIADREHFLAHVGATQSRLFIGRPVLGRVSQRWSIQLSRPVLRQGRFDGVVVFSISPDALIRFAQALSLSEASVATVVRQDGVLLSRYPQWQPYITQSLADLPMLRREVPMEGNFERVSVLDGVHRLYGYAQLQEFPVVAIVGIPQDQLLQGIREQGLLYIAGATVVSVFLLLLAALLHRYVHLQWRNAEWLEQRVDERTAELVRKDQHIRDLAYLDQLTGLANRRLLIDRLDELLHQRDGQWGALLFMDLDHFKQLNDSQGHDYGDLLLQQVGQRLKQVVRDSDTVARLGGDEFVIMLGRLGTTAENASAHAQAVSEKILQTLNAPYLLNGSDYHCSPSIGVTLFGPEDLSVDGILKKADLAMYQAKGGGRNGIRFFNQALQQDWSKRIDLDEMIQQGLWHEQVVLHYQSQVNDRGQVLGIEALVRWNHPVHGLLKPAEFLPFAENSGLIVPLGHVVLESVVYQIAAWQQEDHLRGLPVAVNISQRQLLHPQFEPVLQMLLQNTAIAPSLLVLEISENTLVQRQEAALLVLQRLQALGVGLALDDFGAQWAALSCAAAMPLNLIKLDNRLCQHLDQPAQQALVRSLAFFAVQMGVPWMAKGVENAQQRDALLACGCERFQGYWWAQPVDAEALVKQVLQDQADTPVSKPATKLAKDPMFFAP